MNKSRSNQQSDIQYIFDTYHSHIEHGHEYETCGYEYVWVDEQMEANYEQRTGYGDYDVDLTTDEDLRRAYISMEEVNHDMDLNCPIHQIWELIEQRLLGDNDIHEIQALTENFHMTTPLLNHSVGDHGNWWGEDP